jgi:hypothetical protein
MPHINASPTTAMILSGELDVSSWSDEELRRGQRRDRNGKWGGRPPKVIPKAIHNELVKRTYDKASKILQDSLVDAVTLFATIVRDDKADPAVRLKAATIIVERVMGKEPIKVSVTTQAKWQAAITHSIVSLPAEELLSLESRVIEATEADYIAYDPDEQ